MVKLMGAEVQISDFTLLQKRAAKLGIAIKVANVSDGPIHVVADSTGLKVYTEGEWKARKHGVGMRRTWQKLHLAVNPDTHGIVAETRTENDVHDANQVDELLDQVDADVEAFYGDGAYVQ